MGRGLRRTAWLLTAAALGGCGFHPIYATPDQGASVGTQLAGVKVDPIDYQQQQAIKLYRLGQQLHNALVARIDPDGSSAKAIYAVRIVLTEAESDLAIDPSGLSQRSSIVETAAYKLIALKSGKQVFSGVSTGVNSFGNVSNAYATVEGREDARVRAIGYIADDIATRVALYLRHPTEETN